MWTHRVQVKKCLLTPVLSKLQSLKKKGVKRKRARNCGARGSVTFVDHWEWPKPGAYLFPSQRTSGRVKKDAVCHSIVKARKSFDRDIDTTKVRSHSGRHRMINDMKSSSIPPEAGMMFARIKDKKPWASYGQLSPSQCREVLQKNQCLQKKCRRCTNEHCSNFHSDLEKDLRCGAGARFHEPFRCEETPPLIALLHVHYLLRNRN